MHDLIRILLFCTIALGAAEVLTRRTPASLRWCILAVIWLVVASMVFSMAKE